jgi:hypothetical protein
MHHLPLVEQAMGRQGLALLRNLDAACASADNLEQAVIVSFKQHPYAGIITSSQNSASQNSARSLAPACLPWPPTTDLLR